MEHSGEKRLGTARREEKKGTEERRGQGEEPREERREKTRCESRGGDGGGAGGRTCTKGWHIQERREDELREEKKRREEKN